MEGARKSGGDPFYKVIRVVDNCSINILDEPLHCIEVVFLLHNKEPTEYTDIEI